MKPLKTIFTLFLILLLTYIVSEWSPWKNRKVWEKTIAFENIDLTSTFVISQQGKDGDELTFSKLDSGQWQLTVDNHLQSADADKVKMLLNYLKNTVAFEMITHNSPKFKSTGLEINKKIEVISYIDQQESNHFFIGNAIKDSLTGQFYSFIKKENDKNAYKVKGNFFEPFNQNWKKYIQPPFFDIQLDKLMAVTFRFPCDSVIRFNNTNGVWRSQDNELIDTLTLYQTMGFIKTMKAIDPEPDDLFWMDQRQNILFTDQLELRFKDMVEPILLSKTILPGNKNNCYIFKNSFLPYMFYTLDISKSRALFQWKKMITPKRKAPQTANIGF